GRRIRGRGGVVATSAAARGYLYGRFRGHFQRGQGGRLSQPLRDHLVESDRHACASRRRVRTHAGQPRRGVQSVYGSAGREVLDVLEGRDVSLEGLEGLEDVAELEARTLAARRPRVHFLAEGRVAHDRAM